MSRDTVAEHKSKYYFYLQSGALARSGSNQRLSPVHFSASMVHGIRVNNRYKLGFGVGADYYEIRRLTPVFVSFSADLVASKNKLFIEFNYGGSFASPLTEVFGYDHSEFARMAYPLIGYSIHSENLSIGFVAGYKFQRIVDHYMYPRQTFVADPFPSGENRTTYQIDMSRLSLAVRIGWR